MCNLLTKTTCFLKLSAIYCFAKSVSHYTSDQCGSTWELQNLGDVLKSKGSKGKNLLTSPRAFWPKNRAACTNPTCAPTAELGVVMELSRQQGDKGAAPSSAHKAFPKAVRCWQEYLESYRLFWFRGGLFCARRLLHSRTIIHQVWQAIYWR